MDARPHASYVENLKMNMGRDTRPVVCFPLKAAQTDSAQEKKITVLRAHNVEEPTC